VSILFKLKILSKMCVRRFFEKQRVDEIGFYSVRLQKVLLYLAIFNLLGLLAGLNSWIGALIEVLLLWIAFHGAYKRRARPLRAYVCINITLMIMGVIFLLTALMFFNTQDDKQNYPILDLNPPPSNNKTDLLDLQPPPANVTAPSQNNTNTDFKDIEVPDAHLSGGLIALYLMVIVCQIIVFIMKMISIVMAARLARMICTYNCLQLSSHTCNKPETPSPSPSNSYIPMQPIQPQSSAPMYPQPMYVPVVINGQPNGQPQQFVYPNPYFVPQAMYTPMAPPQSNDKN
jgi:uncharacterized membrane protein